MHVNVGDRAHRATRLVAPWFRETILDQALIPKLNAFLDISYSVTA